MATGTLKIGNNYLNPYEYYHNLLKGNAAFREDDWRYAYNTNSLPELISMMTNKDTPNIDLLEKEYGYNFLDSERRQIALYNELYGNRTDVQTLTEKYTDENGIEQERSFNSTQYDYTKKLLQQARDYELAQLQLEKQQEAKNEMSAFAKTGMSVLSIPTNLAGGVLNFAAGITNLVEGVFDGVTSAIKGEDFSEGFRSAFNNSDFADEYQDWLVDWERQYSYTRDINGNYTPVGKIIGGVSTSIGEMLPTLGLSMITAGAANNLATAGKISAGTATAISNNIGKASKVIYYTGMGSNSFKELSREMPTVPTIKLIANAAAKTVAEAAIEKVLGEAFGPSNLDKLHFSYAPAGAKQFVAKNVLSAFAKDFIQEGSEELLQEFSGYVIDRYFAISDQKFGDASDWNLQTMLDAFIIGGLTTIATNSFDIITTKRVMLSETSFDKDGNLRQTKKGMNIPETLSKANSWLYKRNISDMFSMYEQAINSKDLTLSQRSAALGQMYASYRTIASFYGEIGQERFDAATKMLNAINESMSTYATPLRESSTLHVYSTVEGIDDITAVANKLMSEVSDGKYSLKAEYAKSLLKDSGATKINTTVNAKDDKEKLKNKSNSVKKVVNDSFEKDKNIKSVVLTDDGKRPAEKDGVLLIPLQLAELGDTELIYEMISETLLKNMLQSEKVFAPVLNNFVKIYAETYNIDTPNDVEVIYNVLFNDRFFNVLLYSSNKDTIRFLDDLGRIVDNLSSKNYKEQMFKYTATKTYKAMKKQLIEYCVNQQNIVLKTMKSLSPSEITWIENKRYSKDLANRLISINGVNEITKAERDLLTNKINSLPVDKSVKEKLLFNIFSLNSAARKNALLEINKFYKDLYFGPYNDTIYKNPKFVGDVVFNQFLIEIGLDMTTMLNSDNYNGTFKEEFDNYADLHTGLEMVTYNFIKEKFEEFTGNTFSIDTNLNVTTDIKIDIPLVYSEADSFIDEYPESFLLFDSFKTSLLKSILKPLPESLSKYVTLTDIITNPAQYIDLDKLDKELHRKVSYNKNAGTKDLKYTYNLLAPDDTIKNHTKNVYDFYNILSQYIVNKTKGKFGISQLNDGEFILMRYVDSEYVFNDKLSEKINSLKNGKVIKLGDILNNKFSTDKLAEITIKTVRIKDKKRQAYATDAGIFIAEDMLKEYPKNMAELKNILLHEIHHLYSENAINISGGSHYDISEDVASDIAHHSVDDLDLTGEDIYVYLLGEILARQELPLNITFIRKGDIIVAPWGTQYRLIQKGKNGKLVLANKDSKGKKNISTISAKKTYKPNVYHKFFADKLEAEGFKILYESNGYKAEVVNHNNGYMVNYRKLTKDELPKTEEAPKTTLTELKPEDIGIKSVPKKTNSETDVTTSAENKVFNANDVKSIDENLNIVEYKYQRSFSKQIDAQTFKILQEDKGYQTQIIEQNGKYIVKFGKPEKLELPKKKGKKLTAEDRKALTKQRFLNKPFRVSQATTHTRRVSYEKAEKYPNLKYYAGRTLGPSLQTLLMNFDPKEAKATGQDLTVARELNRLIKSGTISQDDVFSLLRNSKDMDDHTFLVINHAFFRNPYIKTFNDLKKLDAFLLQVKALKVTLKEWVDKRSNGKEQKIAQSYLDSTSMQMTIANMEKLANKVLADPKLQKMYDKNLAYQQKFNTESAHVQILERFEYTIDSLVWAFDTAKKVEVHGFNTTTKKRELSLDASTNEGDTTVGEAYADVNAAEGFNVLTADLDKMEQDLLYYAGEYEKANNPNSTNESINKARAKFYTKMYGDDASIKGMSESQIRGLWLTVNKILELTNFYASRYIKENPGLDVKIYEAARLKYLKTLSKYDKDKLNALYEKFTLSKYSNKGAIGFGASPDKTITSIVKAGERDRTNILQNVNRYKNNIISTLNSVNKEVRTRFMKDGKNSKYFEMDNKGLIHLKPGILRTKDDRPTYLKAEQLLVLEEEFSQISNSIHRGIYANEEQKKRVNKLEKDLEREKNKRLAAEENAKRYKKELKEEKAKFKTVNSQLGPANFNITFNSIDYTSDKDAEYDRIQSIPEPLREILSFSFTKFEKSTIKFNDEENMVMNGKVFFRENAEILSRLTEQDIVDIIGFYKNTSINESTTNLNDLRKYKVFKQYILRYFAEEHHDSTSFLTLNKKLLNDIETIVARDQSVAGTVLSVSRKTMEAIDPIQTIAAKLTKIAGIELSEAEVKDIINTIEHTDFSSKESVSTLTSKFEYYYDKASERSNDTALLERWWRFQRMAMLSSPGTWARNWTSNVTVTVANKFADKLGDWSAEILAGKSNKAELLDGQWQISNVEVSSEVSNYTNAVFVESGLIDYLGIATKYDNNTSDKSLDKLTSLIKASLDNKLFHMNQFKSKRLNKLANFIYSKIDDSKFVRKSAMKYFNSMLQQYVNDVYSEIRIEENSINKKIESERDIIKNLEKYKDKYIEDKERIKEIKKLLPSLKDSETELSKLQKELDTLENETEKILPKKNSYDSHFKKLTALENSLTHIAERKALIFDTKNIPVEILNIFADAYTLASYEYMHRPNVFNDIERAIREHSNPAVYFAYKQVLPFAASGWNWFIEGLKYTPIGLASAIYKFNKLENTIDKMKKQHEKDGRLPSDAFAQYLIKKDLGKGVIGSIGFVIGIILSALGLVGIEEDEYDKTLKIKIADLYIDISDVFGTQSIFLGMATMNSILKAAGDDPYDVLDFVSDFLNQMFMESTLGDVFNMFRYDDTVGEYTVNHLDDSLKMFILNMVLTFSSAVYVNKVQYGTGWENIGRRIAGYIPFVNYAQPYRYDPYTGEKQVKYGGYWFSDIALDVWNKMSPVKFSYHKISEAEKIAASVGVRKKELSGMYKINDESVKLNAVQISALNKYYGELNAKELELLFNNKKVYRVWNEEKKIYQTIRYNKMNKEQKKSVIERIMNDNASTAKVYILTNNGYKYYTSEEEVRYLKSLGLKNIYIKTKKKEGFVN